MSEDATLDDFVKDQDERQQATERRIRGETVPTAWKILTIDDISEQMGDGGTPSRQGDSGYFGGDIPWVVVDDVEFEIGDSKEKLTKKGLDNSSATLWPKGSVIVTTGASIGEVGIAKQPTATKQGITGIIPTDKINSHFLGRYLEANEAALNRFAQGTTFEEIRPYVLRGVEMPLPPLSEQRKIATVLYTVDRAIKKTNEIIEQTERVRAGTAQDLFHNGTSHRKTKETWLGEIPEDWDVVQFSEIVESNRNGMYKPKEAYGEGCPIAKMGNALEKRTLDMSPADRLELTDEEREKYGLKQGDLIFARRAQEVSAAGDCCYVPQLDELTVFESSLIRVRLSEGANPRFYTQYFDGPVGSRSIDRIVTETSISGIATSDLLDLKVALPSSSEQEEIANIMWQFDEQQKALQKEKRQYKRLKRGLMQDLLSGTVRTTDTNIEVPDEIAQYG